MLRVLKVGILFLIFVQLVSCGKKKRVAPPADIFAGWYAQYVKDSTKLAEKIIASINDTFHLQNFKPEFPYSRENISVKFENDSLLLTAHYSYEGNCQNITVTNKKTSETSFRNYYPNGQQQTDAVYVDYSNYYRGGKWIYYSETGKVDSIVDSDKKYPVTYLRAKQIAENLGWKFEDISIEFKTDNGKAFYYITKWYNKEENGSKSSKVQLEIDAYTGKRKFHKENIYMVTVTDAIPCTNG